jgi:hypothetical protein
MLLEGALPAFLNWKAPSTRFGAAACKAMDWGWWPGAVAAFRQPFGAMA